MMSISPIRTHRHIFSLNDVHFFPAPMYAFLLRQCALFLCTGMHFSSASVCTFPPVPLCTFSLIPMCTSPPISMCTSPLTYIGVHFFPAPVCTFLLRRCILLSCINMRFSPAPVCTLLHWCALIYTFLHWCAPMYTGVHWCYNAGNCVIKISFSQCRITVLFLQSHLYYDATNIELFIY